MNECRHLQTEMRLRTITGGAKTVQFQCVACGYATTNAIKKSSLTPETLAALPLFDDELLVKGRIEKNNQWSDWAAEREKERAAKKAEEDAAWWAAYNAYLDTPEWKARSRAVLERDNYVCQACLKNRANQAHHLTYKHLFHEPLFDLVAVCTPCHHGIHPDRFQ